MESSYGRGRLHLAAAIDQRAVGDVGAFVELARLAERGVLDFVTLGDAAGRPGPDASAVLARVAPETVRVGLVPAMAARAEPSRARAAVATLDWVSRGRAGWWIEEPGPQEQREARRFGRWHVASGDEPGRDVGGQGDAATRGAGCEDGAAGVRADGSEWSDGRVGDEGRVGDGGWEEDGREEGGWERSHRVEGAESAEGAGARVRGPAIVPRSPQGRPVRVVDATEGESRGAAARYADVALLRVTDPAHADAVREELRDMAARFGRDPDELRVLASLGVDLGGGEHAAEPGHGGGGPRRTADGPLYRGGPVDLAELVAAWHRTGAVDGFHLVPVEPRRDLERLVNATVALLQHRGLFRTFYPGSTLREHLGLARPVGGCAATARARGKATGAAS
ncbi:LLM class flavin-dependent oxidoreductase [Streptomyces stelliscabiei]|uniref:LLM class flavin-dependent oxidoreductase n=1 Tax=Streptomyces stelliscabiei TaxID=146820 RepID=UPI0029B2739A|nr:LLM class flavin-dependent oxidoreductase [Streptomyces stelliscabiei]MDX2555162.1 LLM class flavin-dependent oxidoreductase [Streptomyces stelliscabiei]MDX2615515.1 LLM class flavin-dependent oxidoreductase [Streptomyces stelliscabiei]MDX2639501.1 LLM class flavin-dependent oxidoreductase [Streptomyces stelliscabiei]MDX2663995.1 LLM class flavin-dependent oxidoreductase [Streptomyces stelliscabiei]MDX2712923.1 LLM class flavin-dependent oxidoreductase [Streptomyces stelliscabiei]